MALKKVAAKRLKDKHNKRKAAKVICPICGQVLPEPINGKKRCTAPGCEWQEEDS